MSYYDLKCPYCDAELEVCHDDGFGYAEGVKHQMECPKCNKNFVFNTYISFDYYAEKADCLNGSDHQWKPTNTFPKEYTKMECTDCETQRSVTEEEKLLFNVP